MCALTHGVRVSPAEGRGWPCFRETRVLSRAVLLRDLWHFSSFLFSLRFQRTTARNAALCLGIACLWCGETGMNGKSKKNFKEAVQDVAQFLS